MTLNFYREHGLASAGMDALGVEEAKPAGDGVCNGCLQHRPLFEHTQTLVFPDWDDAEVAAELGLEQRGNAFCPRCWSATPLLLRVDYGDDWW